MRVLLVNKFCFIKGGDSTYMFNLAELLQQHGHSISYFSMHHPNNKVTAYEKYFVDEIDFIEVNRNKSILNGMKVLSRAIYSHQARKNVAKLIEDVKPDIAHLHNIHAQITPSILYEFQRHNIPVFWTLHDYQWICPNTNMVSHEEICESCKGNKFFQCTIKKCKKDSRGASFVATLEAVVHNLLGVKNLVSKYIAPSEFLINKFTEFGWSPKQIYHLPYFLPKEKFIYDGKVSGNYALYIGRLESYKGVKTLLKAAAIAKEIPLKIVGEGTEKNSLLDFCRESNLTNVEFVGYLSGEKLNQMLHNCGYVIVPSEWYENYPYAVMEAMAAGKAVIASRLGGLPEMIEDGITGYLFAPWDEKDLAYKMRIIHGDNLLRNKMGNAGRDRAKILYDQEFHYEKIMEIYSRKVLYSDNNLPKGIDS